MSIDLNNPCIFCQLIEQNRAVFYENNFFIGKLDEYPVSRGHYTLLPKRHITSMHELDDEEWKYFHLALTKSYKKIQTINLDEMYTALLKQPFDEKSKQLMEQARDSPFKNQPLQDYNGGINEGVLAGRTIHHMHYHIIPRYKGDVKDPTGGVRHILPDNGNYLQNK